MSGELWPQNGLSTYNTFSPDTTLASATSLALCINGYACIWYTNGLSAHALQAVTSLLATVSCVCLEIQLLFSLFTWAF